MANRWGINRNRDKFYFPGTVASDCSHEIKMLAPGRKPMTNLDGVLKTWDVTLPAKVCIVKAMDFPVQMWELDHEEGWVPKNWCFRTVVLEKTLESPFDCKEMQPVHPKGNQSWIFIGRMDAEAEAPIIGPPDAIPRNNSDPNSILESSFASFSVLCYFVFLFSIVSVLSIPFCAELTCINRDLCRAYFQ